MSSPLHWDEVLAVLETSSITASTRWQLLPACFHHCFLRGFVISSQFIGGLCCCLLRTGCCCECYALNWKQSPAHKYYHVSPKSAALSSSVCQFFVHPKPLSVSSTSISPSLPKCWTHVCPRDAAALGVLPHTLGPAAQWQSRLLETLRAVWGSAFRASLAAI